MHCLCYGARSQKEVSRHASGDRTGRGNDSARVNPSESRVQTVEANQPDENSNGLMELNMIGKKANCITKNCKRTQQCRGLCSSCCTQARSLVNAGSTTWLKLEELGLSLPKVSIRSPFMVAYDAKTKASNNKRSRTIPIRKHA